MVVYLDRRQTLGDRAAAPIATRVIGEIDLGPIVRARPGLVEDGNVRIAGMRLSPDDSHVAILLPSQENDYPDQLWLSRVADRTLQPVTPPPDATPTKSPKTLSSLTPMASQGGTEIPIHHLWNNAPNALL